jgi:hypothetical protein
MQYSEFERAIGSPALKDVAAHWNQARQNRRMPRWADIKPSRIAQHLSIVWSFRYDAGKDEFFGRLVGDRIARLVGKSFRGLSLADAYPPDAAPWVRERFRRVVMEPALYNHAGTVYTQMDRHGFGERILLPLSEDGIAADGILGATALHDVTSMPLTLVVPDERAERWSSLMRSGST